MVTVQEIQSIDPYEFEKLVAELWETKGYDTTVRNKTSDKGIDIDAGRGGISEKVQVKRYGQNNKIGSGEVREYATIYQQTNANNVALVTSGEFTDPARELATDLNVNLCSGKELLQQLESSSVDVSEYTDSSQSGHSSTVDMSEMTDKRRASELAEGLSEVTPERLTESYFGEGTTRQSIIECLDDDDTIRQIFTAENEPIAIGSKRSGEVINGMFGSPTYVITNLRILAIMPREELSHTDETHSIPYRSIDSVENHFGQVKHRIEITLTVSNKIYHLWISDEYDNKTINIATQRIVGCSTII